MPAIRTAHPADALVEDAAVKYAVDGGLDAARQIAMRSLKALFIEKEEALDVMGERAAEDRAFRTVWATDLGTGCGCDRLQSKEGRRNRASRACRVARSRELGGRREVAPLDPLATAAEPISSGRVK